MYANLAFYKFVAIDDTETLRQRFETLLHNLPLGGTVLIAPEGVNVFLAGPITDIQSVIDWYNQDLRFVGADFKLSYSETVPFRRKLVKIKSEIIAFGIDNIDPTHFTGEYVTPATLQEWLDSGEEVLMLDTRNDYEIDLGTFANAVKPPIKTFREFPDWIEKSGIAKKHPKIVTFCTGGIRCEKATAHMRQQGFENVYQLQGGILKYFEDIGPDKNYEGDCFVFDYRVAVDANLKPSNLELCYACWTPITEQDKTSPLFDEGICCPKCFDFHLSRTASRKIMMRDNNAKALQRRIERSLSHRAHTAVAAE